ncbi:MAG: hypothetical protein ACYC69_01070 [Thermodesulfovibrionales bacterium]
MNHGTLGPIACFSIQGYGSLRRVSKIEQGINCNIVTFLKVCNALGISRITEVVS